jgi:hypothetical protein
MITYLNAGSSTLTVKEFALRREHEDGITFLSSAALPEFFIAAKDGTDLRAAIDRGLKNALCENAEKVQVYTNGKIDGDYIDVMVKVTSR